MFTPDREELAWAGGFYCGEGSSHWAGQTRSNGRHYGQPTIEVTQASTEVLERFNQAIGGLMTLYGPYTTSSASNPYWKLQTTNFVVIQAVIAMLWPWLSSQKKDQYWTLMKRWEVHRNRPKLKPWDVVKGRANAEVHPLS